MALLNYTTKKGVHETLGEIQQILVDHGARKIMFDYDERGHIKALIFSIQGVNGERGIRLPANTDAVFEVLKQQKKAGNFILRG